MCVVLIFYMRYQLIAGGGGESSSFGPYKQKPYVYFVVHQNAIQNQNCWIVMLENIRPKFTWPFDGNLFSSVFLWRRNEFGRNIYNITAKITNIDIMVKLVPSSVDVSRPDSGTRNVIKKKEKK